MGIRLICSDLDGTLLQYGKKELEGEIFDQIRALHDQPDPPAGICGLRSAVPGKINKRCRTGIPLRGSALRFSKHQKHDVPGMLQCNRNGIYKNCSKYCSVEQRTSILSRASSLCLAFW